MKLMYLSSVNSRVKSGYYYAVTDRLKALKKIAEISTVAINYERKDMEEGGVFDELLNKHFFMGQKGLARYVENQYLIYSILRVLDKHKPDIVHVHWAYSIGYCAIVACKKKSIPCVLTCHGSDIHTFPMCNAYIAKKTRWALEHASALIFVSDSLLRVALGVAPDISKYKVISNGIEFPSIGAIKKTSANQEYIISFVGNLNYTKGADLIPGAFKKISDILYPKSVTFQIAGDGPLRSEVLEKLNKVGVDYNYFGAVNRYDSWQLMANSSLVIMLSRNEGFGLVALETFAVGTPCIAFDIPGLHSVFEGNTDLLVKGNIDCLALLAKRVLLNDLLIDFGVCRSKFDLNFILKKEVDLYSRLNVKGGCLGQ